jgi:hypothetical protein
VEGNLTSSRKNVKRNLQRAVPVTGIKNLDDLARRDYLKGKSRRRSLVPGSALLRPARAL